MKAKLFNYILLVLICTGSACKKSAFLDAKPDQALVVPTTLADLQAILDNDQMMNGGGNFGNVPVLGETGCDNYYVTENNFQIFSLLEKNAYTWAEKVFSGEKILDWDYPYRTVFYANAVLDGLTNLDKEEQPGEWNNLKGSALFYRAHSFYQLAQIFAPSYDKHTASSDTGIPLRLIADINETIRRATTEETYTQIINDLTEAISLLPVTPLYKTRPCKAAAYGLMSRVYQTMEDYDKALLYADSCLQLQNALLDFNALDTTATFPIERFNKEVIFQSTLITDKPIVLSGSAITDSTLYNSYETNDLRKAIFFKRRSSGEGMSPKASYDGSPYYFGGIATDEIYLIRAECYARTGKVQKAMNDLNTLLITRWKAGTFIPFTATDADNALQQILTERRKELIFRGLRWTDLRRLNKDSRFAITLTRNIAGALYSLPPNDPRYVYPIPDDVIDFNPGMAQNLR